VTAITIFPNLAKRMARSGEESPILFMRFGVSERSGQRELAEVRLALDRNGSGPCHGGVAGTRERGLFI
jgi:hypothetical protein